MKKNIIFFAIFLLLFSQKIFSQEKEKLLHSFFILKNAEKIKKNNFVLQNINKKIEANKSSLLFLGSNIFQKKREENYFLKNLEIFKDFKENIFFTGGKNDWKSYTKIKNILKEERKFIENFLNKKNVFQPKNSCDVFSEFVINDKIVLFFIDSQWMSENFYTENFEERACGKIKKSSDFIEKLSYSLRKQKNKIMIFVSYHSFLKKNDKKIYNSNYLLLKKKLLKVFKNFPNLIIISADRKKNHYIKKDSLHQITVASARKNFARLDFYKNGDLFLKFFEISKEQNEKIIFEKKIFNKKIFFQKNDENLKKINYSDSTIFRSASENYKANKLKRFLFGDNYRDVWSSKINFPYFDISKEKGGLKIIKRGGGMASYSFRMEDKNGKQYVLRSVEKFAGKNLPFEILNTFAVDIIQDQISASHPYAALIIPKLADAVGIYHTNPKIFYVPNDENLGKYKDDMAGNLFLFEERPAKNREDLNSFGNSKKIISTLDVIDNIMESPKFKVCQKSVLKARLFDIFINDWDRHEDQFRFAAFKEKEKTIYKVIPRDRDQAFFLVEGIFPKIASSRWILPKLQGFENDTKYLEGLIFNGKYFDRSFLNELSLETWQETIKELQEKLSDEIIEKSVKSLPKEIYEISGEEIISKLKSRRKNLKKLSEKAYFFLSKKVDILGTNKKEYFEINRLDDEKTNLKIFTLKKHKSKKKKFIKGEKIFERTFKNSETKEISIYGLDGKDKFFVKGNVNKGIKIRIIGGKGRDEIIDESFVKGFSKKTMVYDLKNEDRKNLYAHGRKYKLNTILEIGNETKNFTSKKYNINEYDRTAFKYDLIKPELSFSYNVDDGIFIGTGISQKTHSFRKEPFSTYQKIIGNFSVKTHSFKIIYSGEFNHLIREADFVLKTHFNAPNYVGNYFGMGNETNFLEENIKDEFYHIKFSEFFFNPMLRKRLEDITFFFGAFYQSVKIQKGENNFLSFLENTNNLEEGIFEKKNYLGLNVNYEFDTRDDKILVTRGLMWNLYFFLYYGLKERSKNYTSLKTDFRYFKNFKKFVLCFRAGGGINSGEYEFFQANSLGRDENLRGFHRNRFAGDANIYQNTELRFTISNFNNYLWTGKYGILVFNDFGKVFLKNENSNKIHQSYGFAFWIAPFRKMIFRANFSKNTENKLNFFEIKGNYFF